MKHKSGLPKKLQEEVERFFEQTPADRLSRNLRRLLLDYLSIQKDAFGMNIQDLFTDMIWLFELLDIAQDELKE